MSFHYGKNSFQGDRGKNCDGTSLLGEGTVRKSIAGEVLQKTGAEGCIHDADGFSHDSAVGTRIPEEAIAEFIHKAADSYATEKNAETIFEGVISHSISRKITYRNSVYLGYVHKCLKNLVNVGDFKKQIWPC